MAARPNRTLFIANILAAGALWAFAASFGCAGDAQTTRTAGADGADGSGSAKTLAPPSSAADVRSVAVPCAVTGEGVRCWGSIGGKEQLAPPTGDAARLADSTSIFRVGNALCGRKDAAAAWRCTWLPHAIVHEPDAPSWPKVLEGFGPTLVDAAFHTTYQQVPDALFALLADGTVIVHDKKGQTREKAQPGRSIRALDCIGKGAERRGWAVLGTDGQVFLSPTCEGFDTPAWKDVVQIDGGGTLLCARTEDGRVLATTRRGSLADGVGAALASMDDAADIACSNKAGCVLHTTGRVSCVGEIELGKAFSNDPLELEVAGVQNARDVWMSPGGQGVTDLCIARGTEVLCSSVGGGTELHNLAVPVEGVPDLVDVATDQYFACGRTPKNTVWCWGNRGAPFEVRGASSRGITVAWGVLYSLNASGGLERRALAVASDRVKQMTADPPVTLPVPDAWPNPPENVDLSSCGMSHHFVCARAKEQARCWSFKQDGTDPQTIEVPFPVTAIVPGPPVAAQRAGGGIALLAPKSKTWLDGTKVNGAERLGPPRLVEGEQGGSFLLSFGGGQSKSCNTDDTGPVCAPFRSEEERDWVRGSFARREGKLYERHGSGDPILEGVRDVDAGSGAIVLFDIPGKPHVVSYNATPMGLAGEFGRAGRLTALRQAARR